MKPKVLVFSGYGLNSEEETAYGFELAGAGADIVHINDIVDRLYDFKKYQILAFPGGFSYGDDTGAGNAYANKLRNHLWEELEKFIKQDKLVIGICNGCQIVANLGLIPAFNRHYGERKAALIHNESARLVTRWTDMKAITKSPWLDGIDQISLPIAHGEGKFFIEKENLKRLHDNNQIALQYIRGTISNYLGYPANPNGSLDDIAGITDETGRILGLMPHPERGMFFVQRPDSGFLKEKYRRAGKLLPEFSDGLQIFKNAVKYFR
ncbi:phosphoribosylformylglycinamidine synthase subunit PurQ [Patescibacteria group bacterium]|nr:phosphoribosylformylglycinamidine synthase subunit PurQ [Patescibacteria group bacterium]MBU4017399.1 phosphoribosylformylglycinamidine synthase subunit PurQ [Patescibacteria group bacterium]MBU4099437.1 phosphoribosylformylglycinamidine synthase subunit PurQ [Patescibacteria group bacterium]